MASTRCYWESNDAKIQAYPRRRCADYAGSLQGGREYKYCEDRDDGRSAKTGKRLLRRQNPRDPECHDYKQCHEVGRYQVGNEEHQRDGEDDESNFELVGHCPKYTIIRSRLK